MLPALSRGVFDSPDGFALRVSAVLRVQDRSGAEDVCPLYILYYRPKSKMMRRKDRTELPRVKSLLMRKLRWSKPPLLITALLTILLMTPALKAAGPNTSSPQPFQGVLTYHNDNARSSLNPFETTLTPANVNSTTFGKLFSYPVDGYIYGQPLYVPGVSIPLIGLRNVVYVVTEHDSVYAFDADGLSGQPLWHTSFINPAAGITTVPSANVDSNDIVPEIGITGTPVIDPSGTLYVVSKIKDNGEYFQQLHALDITTGSERTSSPRVIAPKVAGRGDGHLPNGRIPFDALRQNQRAALAEVGGKIFVAFASHGDNRPYHGWVLGFDARTLALSTMYIDTPGGSEGGIWQGGNGIAADSANAIYFVSGNGTFDANARGLDYGDSAIKLSAAALTQKRVLRASDYFTPYNQRHLSNQDLDMGTAGAVLLPDQTVGPAHLLVTADKAGTVYLLDRDHMGHYLADGDTQIVQELPNLLGANYTPPAVFNNFLYLSSYNTPVFAIPIVNGKLSLASEVTTSSAFEFPGVVPTISANGTSDGIMWVLDLRFSSDAVLVAYDAATLSILYNSDNSRDQAGPPVKFTTPTVANGKVYVGTQTELDVYGLLGP
jgi:outer membrane protein assembly factor BamB